MCVCSRVDGHLGSFWFGAVMNKGAVNLHVQASACTCHFHLLGSYLGVELLGLRLV